MLRFLFSIALLIVSVACTPTSVQGMTDTPAEAVLAATLSPVTSVPTAHLAPSATATLPPTPTQTPTPTFTPTFTPSPTQTPTLTPSATPTVRASSTALRTNTPPATATSIPAATATRGATAQPPAEGEMITLADHYYLGRPLSDNAVNYSARTYPYGSTGGGRYQVHLGQDLTNPTGTPVIAAADGIVIHAGDDLTTLIGPINNYYGKAVIIEHTFRDINGLPVYTLYGHLSNTAVSVGETVKRGDTIAYVGATGVALGPHLHFEVRVGSPFDYRATRNPDLWVFPYYGFGTLAGLVTDAAGNRLNDVTLNIVSDTVTRYAFSYADDTVNSDTTFGENWTLGDLPEGYYTVIVSEAGRVRFSQEVYVFPAKTTWVNVVLQP